MASSSAVRDALQEIARRTDEDMSERDVENLFLETRFYDGLGYEGTGIDIRSEFTLPDDKRPDYITLDSNEAVTAVYEFKTTGRDLSPHTNQLFGYMEFLQADYGVLTNGEQFHVYRQGGSQPFIELSMQSVTESEAHNIISTLEKREFNLTNADELDQFISALDPIPLDKQAELGQEHFFDTFRLEEGSPFADLVTGLMDLLEELRDEKTPNSSEGPTTFGRLPTQANRTKSRIHGNHSSMETSRCKTSCFVWKAVTPSSLGCCLPKPQKTMISSLEPPTTGWTSTFEDSKASVRRLILTPSLSQLTTSSTTCRNS